MSLDRLVELLHELQAEGHGDAIVKVGESGLDTVPSSAYEFDNEVHIN